MLGITIIAVGRLKEDFFVAAADEYAKRLRGFCRLKIIEVKQENLPDSPNKAQIDSALEKEAQQILKQIPHSAAVAVMCVEGKELSSEELALFIKETSLRSGELVFIIGGSHGLAESVKKRADARISVSKMTFPHRLFRVMLLEQIYRAFTINAGGKYHK